MAIHAHYMYPDNLGFDDHQHQKIIPSFDQLHNTETINLDQHQQIQSIPLSLSLHSLLTRQTQRHSLEFHHLIHLQNERLRFAMQEKRKLQTSQLIKKYESKAQFLLNHKQDEITKAANTTMELQDHLKRLEIESQTWERAAKENEALAASLTATIQRLRDSACCLSAEAAGDAESACCQNTPSELEQQKSPLPMICRCCNSRNSCVVMLPCRHLCCCKDCEIFLESCPICRMTKKSSIEAFI